VDPARSQNMIVAWRNSGSTLPGVCCRDSGAGALAGALSAGGCDPASAIDPSRTPQLWQKTALALTSDAQFRHARGIPAPQPSHNLTPGLASKPQVAHCINPPGLDCRASLLSAEFLRRDHNQFILTTNRQAQQLRVSRFHPDSGWMRLSPHASPPRANKPLRSRNQSFQRRAAHGAIQEEPHVQLEISPESRRLCHGRLRLAACARGPLQGIVP